MTKREIGPIEMGMASKAKLLTIKGIVPKLIVMGPKFHAALCAEMGRLEGVTLTQWLGIPIEITTQFEPGGMGFFSGPLN